MLDLGISILPFPIQVVGFENIQKFLKEVLKVLPFPKPTLFTGPNSSIELCETISYTGQKRVLIVTDATLLGLGILDKIQNTLKENKVEYFIYDGILPDPTYNQVQEGLEIFKENQCDSVLAVGGGSSIDAAKIISALATNQKSIQEISGMFQVWKLPAPLYAIPTTAGTGSEGTVAAVVSDPKTNQKTLIMDPKVVPQMAALDPTLMIGLPPHITAATGMDALTHAIEAYVSTNALPDSDSNALAATKLIMENLTNAVNEGQNLKARQSMAMASFYAGLAFTRAGVGYVHAIAHNFGAKYHTPHGLANAIVLPHILEFSKENILERLAKLAEVSGLKQDNDTKEDLAQKFIDKIQKMKREYDIPDKLKELKKDDIPSIAREALKEAHFTYAVPRYMDQSQCESIVAKMMN